MVTSFPRKTWPALLILFLSAILYLMLSNRHEIGFFEDDAIYILCTRSLLSGHYCDLTSPQSPPEIQYLPGFPALLAPFLALTHQHWSRLKVIPWFLSVLSCFLGWTLFRRMLPEKPACAALALFALSPLTIFMSDILLSEWWLLSLSLVAILLMADIETGHPNIWKKIALALVLSWTALTRPEGILLSAALAGILLFRPDPSGQFRWILPIPFAALSSWFIRNLMVSGQMSELWALMAATGLVSYSKHYQRRRFSGLGHISRNQCRQALVRAYRDACDRRRVSGRIH
jgi:hypothetical protein